MPEQLEKKKNSYLKIYLNMQMVALPLLVLPESGYK